jgi:hypothetical protein
VLVGVRTNTHVARHTSHIKTIRHVTSHVTFQLLSAMHADFHLPRGAPGPAHEILCNLQVSVRHKSRGLLQASCQTSHVTPHKAHLTRHTSHLTPHTSHLTPHTSHLTPHTSHLTPHTCRSCVVHEISNVCECECDVLFCCFRTAGSSATTATDASYSCIMNTRCCDPPPPLSCDLPPLLSPSVPKFGFIPAAVCTNLVFPPFPSPDILADRC